MYALAVHIYTGLWAKEAANVKSCRLNSHSVLGNST